MTGVIRMVTDTHWQDPDNQQHYRELSQHIVVKADYAKDKLCKELDVLGFLMHFSLLSDIFLKHSTLV